MFIKCIGCGDKCSFTEHKWSGPVMGCCILLTFRARKKFRKAKNGMFIYQKLQYIVFGNPLGGRDSSDGIATRYELDGPGIESL